MKPSILTNLLKSAYRDKPRGTVAEIRAACRAEVGSVGDKFVDALFEYWFNNSFGDFSVVMKSDHDVAVLPVTQPMERAAIARQRTQEIKSKIVAALMDHKLSTGQMLRHATFGDVANEGGWLSALSRCGKSNEVIGRKLTEKDVQNIASRYWKKAA